MNIELPLGNPNQFEKPALIHAGRQLGPVTLAWPIVVAVRYSEPVYLVALDLVGYFELRGQGRTLEDALDDLGGAISEAMLRECQVPADELTEERRQRLRNIARLIT